MQLIQTVKHHEVVEKKRCGAEGAPSDAGKAGAGPSRKNSKSQNAKPEVDLSGVVLDLPMLSEAPPDERAELLRRKIEVCTVVFDFQSDAMQREKEAKRQALLEIFQIDTRNCFNEALMQGTVDMIGANIFRALRTRHGEAPAFSDPEADEPLLERAWPHLQVVYEFFLRFVASNDVDPRIAKRFLDQNFILKLLELFDSEDPRERDYLKMILHRIYGKFMALRSFIRRAIQHVFFRVMYESGAHNGVGELLEILGSIVNGFALPLKEEHKDLLVRALIPMHKARCLPAFHQQLSYCMSQYAEKEPRLAHDIVAAMLRFWPVSVTSKQVLFLNELEDILELTPPAEFRRLRRPLARRLAACIGSPHFQVAERALFFWNSDHIVRLINESRQELFPLLVGALSRNSRQHWNSAVQRLTNNVLKLLINADPRLFDECSARHRADEERELHTEQSRLDKWRLLQELHDRKLITS